MTSLGFVRSQAVSLLALWIGAVPRDLDPVAEKLEVPRDARVPVLRRPLHEAQGDDYTDIVGADLYAQAGARGDFFTVFDRLRAVHGGRKMVALTECGALPEINDRAPWAWFLAWDDLIARPEVNPPAIVGQTYRSPRVATLPSAP